MYNDFNKNVYKEKLNESFFPENSNIIPKRNNFIKQSVESVDETKEEISVLKEETEPNQRISAYKKEEKFQELLKQTKKSAPRIMNESGENLIHNQFRGINNSWKN